MDDDIKKLKAERCDKLIEIISGEQKIPEIMSKNLENLTLPDNPGSKKITIQEARNIALEGLEKTRTCTRCGFTGPEKKFHKAGNVGFIDVCLKCVSLVRVHNRKAREEGRVIVGYLDVVISFAKYPEILETLQADADRNFRTLENEILFRLVNNG